MPIQNDVTLTAWTGKDVGPSSCMEASMAENRDRPARRPPASAAVSLPRPISCNGGQFMNAAFLLLTSAWLAGADPVAAPVIAPAPGACCGGACGCCDTCDPCCCEKESCWARFCRRFRHHDCCDSCETKCCEPKCCAPKCCEPKCCAPKCCEPKCCEPCCEKESWWTRFCNRCRHHDCCNTCDTCCDTCGGHGTIAPMPAAPVMPPAPGAPGAAPAPGPKAEPIAPPKEEKKEEETAHPLEQGPAIPAAPKSTSDVPF